MEPKEEARLRQAVAAALRARRGIAAISQAEMERRSGITRSSYRLYESGDRVPTVVNLVDIADALGISLGTLMAEIERQLDAQQ